MPLCFIKVSFDVDEYIVPIPGDGSVTVKGVHWLYYYRYRYYGTYVCMYVCADYIEAFSVYIDRFPDEPAITVQLMPQFWFNNFAIEDLLQVYIYIHTYISIY